MKGLTANATHFTVTPKPRYHTGFVDCEGNELEPGDLVIWANPYGRARTVIITRFTPRRIYFKMQYLDTWHVDKGQEYNHYEGCCQLAHYPFYSCIGPDAKRMMHKVLKVEEV